jgi:flagellar biosynthesis protein FliP
VDAPDFIAAMGFSAVAAALALFLALVFSSYVKIVTVLSIVRFGLGVESLPAVVVTGGLALALSFFVMYPTLDAATTAMDRTVSASGRPVNDQVRAAAINAGLLQWKQFLDRHTHETEKMRFLQVAERIDGTAVDHQKPETPSASSWRVLAPAFLVSELKEAFATGLSLLLPFLIVDLVVAHVMLAIGLERLNPTSISFPFKLLLFVMVDGWALITANLAATYA